MDLGGIWVAGTPQLQPKLTNLPEAGLDQGSKLVELDRDRIAHLFGIGRRSAYRCSCSSVIPMSAAAIGPLTVMTIRDARVSAT